jgi:hypothetical protein
MRVREFIDYLIVVFQTIGANAVAFSKAYAFVLVKMI